MKLSKLLPIAFYRFLKSALVEKFLISSVIFQGIIGEVLPPTFTTPLSLPSPLHLHLHPLSFPSLISLLLSPPPNPLFPSPFPVLSPSPLILPTSSFILLFLSHPLHLFFPSSLFPSPSLYPPTPHSPTLTSTHHKRDRSAANINSISILIFDLFKILPKLERTFYTWSKKTGNFRCVGQAASFCHSLITPPQRCIVQLKCENCPTP